MLCKNKISLLVYLVKENKTITKRNNKKQLHKPLRKQVRFLVTKVTLVAALILCILAFAFQHLPTDTTPACMHGRRQRATDAKETKDKISLYCVFVLLLTSISDRDTNSSTITRHPRIDGSRPSAPLGWCASHWAHKQTVALSLTGPAYEEKTSNERQHQWRWSTKAPTPCLPWLARWSTKHQDATSVCTMILPCWSMFRFA